MYLLATSQFHLPLMFGSAVPVPLHLPGEIQTSQGAAAFIGASDAELAFGAVREHEFGWPPHLYEATALATHDEPALFPVSAGVVPLTRLRIEREINLAEVLGPRGEYILAEIGRCADPEHVRLPSLDPGSAEVGRMVAGHLERLGADAPRLGCLIPVTTELIPDALAARSTTRYENALLEAAALQGDPVERDPLLRGVARFVEHSAERAVDQGFRAGLPPEAASQIAYWARPMEVARLAKGSLVRHLAVPHLGADPWETLFRLACQNVQLVAVSDAGEAITAPLDPGAP